VQINAPDGTRYVDMCMRPCVSLIDTVTMSCEMLGEPIMSPLHVIVVMLAMLCALYTVNLLLPDIATVYCLVFMLFQHILV